MSDIIKNLNVTIATANIYKELKSLNDDLANNSRFTIINNITADTKDDNIYIAKKSLLSANISRIAEHIYSGVPVMFISAERSENTRNQNELQRKRLVVDIINNDLSFVKIAGSWSDKKQNDTGYESASEEISFMVLGYNRHGNKIMNYDEFKILAFDLTVFISSVMRNNNFPNFLIHDGVFHADELLLKCPTRYEEAVPEQAASK